MSSSVRDHFLWLVGCYCKLNDSPQNNVIRRNPQTHTYIHALGWGGVRSRPYFAQDKSDPILFD